MESINAAEIFRAISNIETFDPFCMKERVTIADIRKRLLLDITKARNWSKEKIFCKLVDEFTMRAARGETGSRFTNFYDKYPDSDVWHLDESEFKKIFKGKRFADRDAQVALECREVFIKKYGSDWNKYFDESEKLREKNNFEDDPFLKIKYVGFKTRDLGLESFSKDFIAVDIHIRRTLFRIGLIIKGYQYGIEIPNGADNNRDYLNFVSICRKIGEEANISLMEIDKSLWHLGREFCGSEPKCNKCILAIKKLCAFKHRFILNE